ncbi:glycosyltransferase [Nesterenkonia sp. YGD6]|uniref:glycosyltransferase n=1 Tax=Nesterenkonia sp. YGD6 TaxID=2901231 RepID=UPI001F4D169A|nr:glycosyltransferase [Nesterenkonia sp. YGD6]MCH8563286.1 glycosyltransferase [Nesterenkonia sp. YGD6]
MENREVIFVSNVLANGGAGRVLSLLVNSFSSRERRVGVLSFLPHEGEYRLDDRVLKEYAGPGNGVWAKIRRIWWIRGIAKRNPGASIVAFEYFVNMQVLVACLGLPNRVIVSERNDPAQVGNDFPTDFLRKILYQTAEALVCQTDEAASYFSKRITKTVILNPISPELPAPVTTVRRKTVVSFCRLEPQKNLEMLIRAFAAFHKSCPEYTLEIYGDGKERCALIALIDSLSLGSVASVLPARSDVHDVVRDCAVFVLPSHYEGLSNSMMEAMALGLPTVCTDCPCGGARMVIEDGVNGLLVPVDDVDALVEALKRLAEDQDLSARIGRAAEELRDRLSLDAIMAEWETLVAPTMVQ